MWLKRPRRATAWRARLRFKGFADPTRFDSPVMRSIAQLGQVVKDFKSAAM
jgi:hypothetical protein